MTNRRSNAKASRQTKAALRKEAEAHLASMNDLGDRALLHYRLTTTSIVMIDDACLFLSMAGDPKTAPRQREACLRAVRDALLTMRCDLIQYSEQSRVAPK